MGFDSSSRRIFYADKSILETDIALGPSLGKSCASRGKERMRVHLIEADVQRLCQAFGNIISNAVKYTGSVPGQLR